MLRLTGFILVFNLIFSYQLALSGEANGQDLKKTNNVQYFLGVVKSKTKGQTTTSNTFNRKGDMSGVFAGTKHGFKNWLLKTEISYENGKISGDIYPKNSTRWFLDGNVSIGYRLFGAELYGTYGIFSGVTNPAKLSKHGKIRMEGESYGVSFHYPINDSLFVAFEKYFRKAKNADTEWTKILTNNRFESNRLKLGFNF